MRVAAGTTEFRWRMFAPLLPMFAPLLPMLAPLLPMFAPLLPMLAPHIPVVLNPHDEILTCYGQWLQRKQSKFYQAGVRDVFESWQEAFDNMETVLEIQTYPVITTSVYATPRL